MNTLHKMLSFMPHFESRAFFSSFFLLDAPIRRAWTSTGTRTRRRLGFNGNGPSHVWALVLLSSY